MDKLLLNDALYYPFISLPDDSWLRTSLLFWDTINPIVPSPIFNAMSSDSLLKKLKQRNVAQPIYPGKYSNDPRIGDSLTDSVLSYADKFKKVLKTIKDDDFSSRIHRYKMPWRLKNELIKLDFLRINRDDPNWFYLYYPIGNIFMGELARFISTECAMVPITNTLSYAEHIYGLPVNQSRNFTSNFIDKVKNIFIGDKASELQLEETINPRNLAINFLMKNILPTPPPDMDIEILIEIKETDENRILFYNFRNSFHDLNDKIKDKTNKNEVISELQKFQNGIRRDVKLIEELFKRRNKDISFSDFGAVLSVNKPINLLTKLGLTTATLTVSPLFLIGLAAYIGYDILKGRHDIDSKLKDSINNCQGAYIFRLENELSKYIGTESNLFSKLSIA
jgi:hypothetical protein